jgi:hypothetical protein
MLKRFLPWIVLKEDLHNNEHRPPHVSEGDIWWASVGENVGSEINGKSKLFFRPVVILRKLISWCLRRRNSVPEAGLLRFARTKRLCRRVCIKPARSITGGYRQSWAPLMTKILHA